MIEDSVKDLGKTPLNFSEGTNRNLKYEAKFKKYLFKGDYSRYVAICKQINAKVVE